MLTQRQVPYIPGIQERFARAFDAYLTIRRDADKLANKALGRDAPDYHAKHCCPACPGKVRNILLDAICLPLTSYRMTSALSN